MSYPGVDRPDSDLTNPYVVQWLIPATKLAVDLSGSLIAVDLRLQLTGVGRDQDEVGRRSTGPASRSSAAASR